MGGGALIALLATATAAPCEPLPDVIGDAEQALFEGRIDDAAAAMERSEAALACGEPAAPAVLARLWLVEGAAAVLAGDAEAGAEAYAAAARTDPSAWNDDYGPALREAYDKAQASSEGGSLVVDAVDPEVVVRVDGAEQSSPVAVVAGLHAVQVHLPEAPVGYGRTVLVLPEQTLTVAVDKLDAPVGPVPRAEPVVVVEVPVAPVVLEPVAKRAPVWLAAGVGALGLAGGAAGLYAVQNGSMRNASDRAELDAARNRQRGASAAGIGLGAVGALCLTVHLVR